MNAVTVTELPAHAAEQAIREHFAPKLELVPIKQVLPVYPAKRLHAPAGNEAEHSFERAQAVRESLRPRMSDQAYWALRNEVNSTNTDALGFAR